MRKTTVILTFLNHCFQPFQNNDVENKSIHILSAVEKCFFDMLSLDIETNVSNKQEKKIGVNPTFIMIVFEIIC